jgi:hypothetical protein
VVNPLEVEDQALGELLEASDLSPHPGLALERVLEEPAPAGRDVVLLTHPRNLVEADVAGAARRVGPGMRLFGVGVDDHGDVQFAELKHGTPVKVCQFHIDLTRSAPPRPQTVEQPTNLEPLTPWQGDVEPLGFPFCFGLMSHLKRFDFDQAGEWLLVAGQHGMLYAWKTDGTRMEVLPRGLLGPTVLTDVEHLLGVAGGFVVCGVINDSLTAFHYDWTRRTVTTYPMDFARQHGPFHWHYSHEHHALTVVSTGLLCTDLAVYCRGVDLATAERFPPAKGSPTGASRVAEACAAAPQRTAPPPYLMITTDPSTTWQHPGLYLTGDTGTIQPRGVDQEWLPFRPMSEGRSLLENQRLLWGVCRADVLALVTFDNQQHQTLRLFRGPDGIPLAEHPTHGHVALSSDGRLVAYSRGPSQVVVRTTDGGTVPLLMTVKGHAHPRIDIRLGRKLLVVRVGHHGHLFNWHSEELQITPLTDETRSSTPKAVRVLETCGTRALSAGLPDWVRYDPRRFVQAARAEVIVVSDSFGQLMVFDRSGKLVCMFFVFREQAGAWMPDGTRYGPASITGGLPTPGALGKLGRALREAAELPGRSVP